jgi:hypothetical protein
MYTSDERQDFDNMTSLNRCMYHVPTIAARPPTVHGSMQPLVPCENRERAQT